MPYRTRCCSQPYSSRAFRLSDVNDTVASISIAHSCTISLIAPLCVMYRNMKFCSGCETSTDKNEMNCHGVL